jgi:hypothetical protein
MGKQLLEPCTCINKAKWTFLILFSLNAQLVKALRYKPEGSGFDSRWDHLDFSFTYIFRQHYFLGTD